MDVLIDTHVLLWWQSDRDKLAGVVREILRDPDNTILVSPATIWEIATKRRAGKLQFNGPIAASIAGNGFHELPITARDAELAGDLDWEHRDPFDRMIVAQCMNNTLTLVTADRIILSRAGIATLKAI